MRKGIKSNTSLSDEIKQNLITISFKAVWWRKRVKSNTSLSKAWCQSGQYRLLELDFIRKVFIEINNYPKNLVEATIKKVEQSYLSNTTKDPVVQNDGNNDDSETRMVTLKVPYLEKKVQEC